MTDEEKSKILAEMVGWQHKELSDHPDATHGWVDENGLIIWTNDGYWSTYHFDLYDTENMALAWRVLNWAMHEELMGRMVVGGKNIPLTDWYIEQDLECRPPADAQRAWLDKILELTDSIEMEKQDKYNEAYMFMWKASGSGNAKRD